MIIPGSVPDFDPGLLIELEMHETLTGSGMPGVIGCSDRLRRIRSLGSW